MARVALGVALVGLCLASFSCERANARERAANELELELGGDHASLRESLRKVPGEDRHAGAGSGAVPPPVPDREPPPPARVPEPGPSAPPPSPDNPRRAPRSVRLEPGRTVIAVVREHLGDDRRLGEVLALNGWTEAQARRLAAGTVIRLPAR